MAALYLLDAQARARGARQDRLDPYHIMRYMNKALDDVRKREHRAYRARGDETLAR